MKRDFIFVFILLATLSMINAIPHQLHKRVTTFGPCPSSIDASLLTVSVSPDPPVLGQTATYTISGELAKAAPVGSAILIGFFNTIPGDTNVIAPTSTDLCSKVECPASSISITVEQAIPAALPDAYIIVVGITDSDKNYYGCATATIGGGGGAGAGAA